MLFIYISINKYLNEYLITRKTPQFVMRDAETTSKVTQPFRSLRAWQNV